jgi:hypothetical protein
MSVVDNLALLGRRFEPRTAPRSGSRRFTLLDLLEMFDRVAILELTAIAPGRTATTVRPDLQRKIKVSLLDDGVSELHSDKGDWFEVYQTGPSGDLSKVKIVAHHPNGSEVGEIRLLIGRRVPEHYFSEDPILGH